MEEENKTKSAKISFREKMIAKVKEFAVMDSVPVRVKRRMAELKKLSQATTHKLGTGRTADHVTIAPEMTIGDLSARVENGIGVISYIKYKTDKDGNKILVPTTMEMNGKQVEFDGRYEIEHTLVETFRFGEKIDIVVK